MASFNRVILMGNLTRNPETRFTQGGMPIVNFGLAVNRRFQDGEGNWKEEPTFIDVTIFGKRGEAFARFHTKGKPALVEGHLRMDTWDDKNTGQKRSKLYVVGGRLGVRRRRRRARGRGRRRLYGRRATTAPARVLLAAPAAVDETPF
jgi:single-strand DNA-binding protein